MDYCDYEDVGILLALTFDETSSVPPASKVTGIIAMIESEIKLALTAAGIAAPVAGTDLFNVCKLNNMYGAAGVVGMTYNGNKDGVEGVRPDYYRQQYLKFLKDVKENPEMFSSLASSIVMQNQVTDLTFTESEITDNTIGNEWTA
jgi:hypothetical protein